MSSTRIYDVARSKPKESLAIDRFSVKRGTRCCKRSYKIGTWDVKTMNQGDLNIVNGGMSRLDIDILEISELEFAT